MLLLNAPVGQLLPDFHDCTMKYSRVGHFNEQRNCVANKISPRFCRQRTCTLVLIYNMLRILQPQLFSYIELQLNNNIQLYCKKETKLYIHVRLNEVQY